MSILGLAGAHRTGKTSLARAFAEKHNFNLIETSASQVFKDMGYSPSGKYDFATRLVIQEEILKRFDLSYAGYCGDRMSISDRTPLDMLAYTMSEAIGESVSDENQILFKRYAKRCLDITNKRFSILVVVQPGIPIVMAEGKAALNEAYIEHLNSIILGLSVDERVKSSHFYLPRYMVDMDERVAALKFAYDKTVRRNEAELMGATMH